MSAELIKIETLSKWGDSIASRNIEKSDDVTSSLIKIKIKKIREKVETTPHRQSSCNFP